MATASGHSHFKRMTAVVGSGNQDIVAAMNQMTRTLAIPLDVGSYTAIEAARLLQTPARNIRRWMSGYSYRSGGEVRTMPPLWTSQLSMIDEHLELGFRDLIELRFVKAFVDAGVGLKAIRGCLEYAKTVINDAHPFSTHRFQTDGRTIMLESTKDSDDPQYLDLRKRQYVIGRVVERSFKDLDIEDSTVARWRPFNGKPSIIVDPKRAFGQPVAAGAGVPTIVLADAVKAEGAVDRVARLFEVPPSVVRDAVRFEERLHAA